MYGWQRVTGVSINNPAADSQGELREFFVNNFDKEINRLSCVLDKLIIID